MDKPVPYEETKTLMNLIDMCSWISEKYGIDQRDYAGKFKDGYHDDKPYQDFWHYQINHMDLRGNDTYAVINLLHWLNKAEEPWQREIAQMWFDEFNEFASEHGYISVWVSW